MTTFQAFDTKWDKGLSVVTDRPTHNKLESLYKMQADTSEELKYLLQVCAQETTFGDTKNDYCRLKLMVQRHLEQKTKDSHFEARNRQTCNRSSEQRKSKRKRQIQCQEQLRERRLHTLDHAIPINKKGKGKGRPRSPSRTGSQPPTR